MSLFPESARPSQRKQGILPSQDIAELIRNGRIRYRVEISNDQIQPASIDLRLGNVAYQVEASFLPNPSSTITAKIRELKVEELDLSRSAKLEQGKVYVVPLMESLALPADMTAKANPKSTTGRLDVFVRLMTDGGVQFEDVPTGYSGDIYVEIVPRTFPIIVQAGTKLNQLRFWRGKTERDDDELRKIALKDKLVFYENGDGPGQPPHGEEAPAAGHDNGEEAAEAIIDKGLRLSADLQGSDKLAVVAYKAKPNSVPIDLSKLREYDPVDYWEAIANLGGKRMVLERGDFYLLASRERIRVPPKCAAEMEAYDPSLGEFVVHYAGFFDPGFGYGQRGEIRGTKAVLEVRAHEVPILLEHRQPIGRLVYYKMADPPQALYGQSIGSSYQQQGLALSKQFKAAHFTGPLATAIR